jgi:murein DD-endopeptidase MepM/ murein hydrolase activator NlpD
MKVTDPSFGQHMLQQARADQVTAANDSGKATTAEEAGQAFEGYLIEMMVSEMRKTIPEGIFSGNAMEMFSGMLDQELATRIGETGGLGLGAMISQSVSGEQSTPALQVSPSRQVSRTRPVAPSRTRAERAHTHPAPAPAVGGLMRGARIPVQGRISSTFGHRTDPIHSHKRMHRGLDIAAPTGTDIRPVRGGEVVFAGERGGFGNTVIIDHGDGWSSIYAHCDTIDVRSGQHVTSEQVIAAVGSTGRSTGPHLHLEIHRNGEAVDPGEALGLE